MLLDGDTVCRRDIEDDAVHARLLDSAETGFIRFSEVEIDAKQRDRDGRPSRLFGQVLQFCNALAQDFDRVPVSVVPLSVFWEPLAAEFQSTAWASLDVLSGGRLLVGVGTGYIPEELADHGVDPDRRWSVTIDYIKAKNSDSKPRSSTATASSSGRMAKSAGKMTIPNFIQYPSDALGLHYGIWSPPDRVSTAHGQRHGRASVAALNAARE